MPWLVRHFDALRDRLATEDAAAWNAVIVFYLVLLLASTLHGSSGLSPFLYTGF